MKEKPEQLNHLLRQFTDEQDAKQMAEDIQFADRLFTAIPSPAVSPQTLQAIKSQVRRHLTVKSQFRMRILLTSAAAAILLAAGTIFFIKSTQAPDLRQFSGAPLAAAAFLWPDNINSESEDDPVGLLRSEIDSLTGQVDSLQRRTPTWFEDDNGLSAEIQNLNAIATNTDFWKG